MNAETNPRKHPDAAFRPIGDEGGLVVLPGRSEVKVLNPVGIKIFSLLDGEHSREQIVRAVCEEFEVAADQVTADLENFLGELREHGMLEEGDPAPGTRA